MLVLASSPRTTSRLGASMISLSAPPASIGKRTAPPPTVKLVTRSGALAARKSAAAVPLWPEDVGQGLLHGGHGRIFADRDLGGLLTRNARGNAPSHAAACRSAARPTRPASAARLRLPRRLRCSSRVAPGTPDRWPSPARSATPQWAPARNRRSVLRSEEHTSELQSHLNLVCRLLLEKIKLLVVGYALIWLNYDNINNFT